MAATRQKEFDARFAAHVCQREALALGGKVDDRVLLDVARRHSGTVDRRDCRFSELLREQAVNACATTARTTVSDPEKQKQVVVHFVIGRCLSREMLLHFADKGITFFGKGWTQACTKIAAVVARSKPFSCMVVVSGRRILWVAAERMSKKLEKFIRLHGRIAIVHCAYLCCFRDFHALHVSTTT